MEPGAVYIQLKAVEKLEASGTDYIFDLDVRDSNLWMLELMPVILVLFDASRRKAYCLHIQRYFRQDPARQPQQAAKTVRVRVPKPQAVNRRAIAKMRGLKQEILNPPMRTAWHRNLDLRLRTATLRSFNEKKKCRKLLSIRQ